MNRFAREINCTETKVTDWNEVYAQGTFKNVFKGVFCNGPRTNQPCVTKVLRRSAGCGVEYYDNELTIVRKTLELVTRFNQLDHIPMFVYVNIPEIFSTCTHNSYLGKVLIEPFIRNFIKLNSNSGWTLDNDSFLDKMCQALSHFSYHSTRGHFLLCDIQGGTFNKGFAISDPVIMSHRPGTYGPTDLGRDGIITFFAYHDCNEYCMDDWHRPKYRHPILKMKRGTSMIYRPSPQTSRYYL